MVMGFIQSEGSVVADRPVRYKTRTSVTSAAAPATVYDTIADLRNHLEWSGARAKDDSFKLLDLNAPPGRAVVGTTFSSTGANYNGTFHYRSTATEATRPTTGVIETEAHLDRRRGRPWDAHFIHRYDIAPEGTGSRITYSETIERVNYVPYWLHPIVRPLFRLLVNRADRMQLENLARLAEERGRLPSDDV
jgi:hypothetical protein